MVTLVLLQLVAVVAGVYLLASGELGTQGSEPVASAKPSPIPIITAGPVLAARGNGPLPAKGTLAGRLTEALGDPALGDRVGAVVLDAETGATLFDSDAAWESPPPPPPNSSPRSPRWPHWDPTPG
ncbi:hypothetical protein ACFQX6_44510 [Streptosporangium lutulentum]